MRQDQQSRFDIHRPFLSHLVKPGCIAASLLAMVGCGGGSSGGGSTPSNNPPQNQSPEFLTPVSIALPEGLMTVATISATDPDGDSLSFTISGGADQNSFTLSGNNTLSLNHVPNFESSVDNNRDGIYDIEVSVSDGTNTISRSLSITISDVNEAPIITSPSSAVIAEPQQNIISLMADDPDMGDVVSFTITGGVDSEQFVINTPGSQLAFTATPDFLNPADENGDNIYSVIVTASDGNLSNQQSITVIVTEAESALRITTSGFAIIPENSTSVMTVAAISPNPAATITFDTIGGADVNLFTIDSTSGALTFTNPPDFEMPADSDLDGTYEVIIEADDGTLQASRFGPSRRFQC